MALEASVPYIQGPEDLLRGLEAGRSASKPVLVVVGGLEATFLTAYY